VKNAKMEYTLYSLVAEQQSSRAEARQQVLVIAP